MAAESTTPAAAAATLAKKGRVKKLLIGHFSSRYDDNNDFVTEVASLFENVIISEEGKKILLESSIEVIDASDKNIEIAKFHAKKDNFCLLYSSPSPRD